MTARFMMGLLMVTMIVLVGGCGRFVIAPISLPDYETCYTCDHGNK